MDIRGDEAAGVQKATPVQQWRMARSQLASAIQAFSAASSSLDPSDFATVSPTSGYTNHSLNKLDIEEELRALTEEAKRLGDACTWLKIKRNRSHRIVPINRLSEDILTRIFATVIAFGDACTRATDIIKFGKRPRPVFILSSVSTAWRYIVVNTSSFWTHLDVDVSGTSYLFPKRTGLYLERINDAPVDLHIMCINSDLSGPKDSYTVPTIPESLVNRVITSLTIDSGSQLHASALAESWLGNDDAYNLHSFRVSVRCAPYMFPTAGSIGTFGLGHITTLRVSGVGVNWSIIGSSQLTDLDLSNLDMGCSPSIEQLHVILILSPELRILRLCDVSIYAPLESYFTTNSISISLPRLQFLGVGGLPWHLTAHLLQVLVPGPEFSCLSFSCIGFAEEALELLDVFCSRHKVTILSLDMPIYHEQNLAIFIRSLKDLHTLNLSNLDLKTHAFPDILSDRSEAIESNSSTDFPRIRRLRLFKCTILVSALKSLTFTHPIIWLRMDSCILIEGRRNPSGHWEQYSIPDVPDSLIEWLSNAVQELQVNDTEGTALQDLPWWLLPL